MPADIYPEDEALACRVSGEVEAEGGAQASVLLESSVFTLLCLAFTFPLDGSFLMLD